jgi:RNA polymerase sigma factor (TIGR02999 family)
MRHVPQERSQLVTQLLGRWKAGDGNALEQFLPLVYNELRDIARRHLQRERPGHTLQSTALVHEAYLRLLDQRPFDTENRAHFLSVASRLMRQILVDYARSHLAAKRGADRRVELDTSMIVEQSRTADVLALNDALTSLSKLDEQQGRIVELRFIWRTSHRRNCGDTGRFAFDHQTRLECGQGVAHERNETREPWGLQRIGKELKRSSVKCWNVNRTNEPTT